MPTENQQNARGTADLTGMFFGIEIECRDVTRERAARAIAERLGGTYRHEGGVYDKNDAITPFGIFRAVRDSSINDRNGGCEIVSPKMRYEDLDKLQEVVRAVKAAGGKVDRSCGIHVHVNASDLNAKALKNLAKTVYSNEEILYKALGVLDNRRERWAKPVSRDFVEKMKRVRGSANLNTIKRAWYGTRDTRRAEQCARYHYHSGIGSRYHGLNYHSVFYHGTVEFRYFNGSLHAGKIKSYIQLCLALVKKAKTANGARSHKKEYNERTAKYDFRTFLLGLGLKGEEFKSARLHLLKRLPGDAAFRNGRPARAAS